MLVTQNFEDRLNISVFRIVIVLTDQASLFFPVVSRLDKAKFLKLGIIGLKTSPGGHFLDLGHFTFWNPAEKVEN